MKCPKCGHVVELDVRYCPRCQTYLGGVKPDKETNSPCSTGGRGSAEKETSKVGSNEGKRHHVIILGCQEWYAIKWDIGIIIDSNNIGCVPPKGRMDYEVEGSYFEIQVGYGHKMRRKSKPMTFRCSEGVTILQIVTSRWSGNVWVEQVEQKGDLCQ